MFGSVVSLRMFKRNKIKIGDTGLHGNELEQNLFFLSLCGRLC